MAALRKQSQTNATFESLPFRPFSRSQVNHPLVFPRNYLRNADIPVKLGWPGGDHVTARVAHNPSQLIQEVHLKNERNLIFFTQKGRWSRYQEPIITKRTKLYDFNRVYIRTHLDNQSSPVAYCSASTEFLDLCRVKLISLSEHYFVCEWRICNKICTARCNNCIYLQQNILFSKQ